MHLTCSLRLSMVAKVERAPCSVVDQTGCAPTEVCVDGMCVPGIQ